jgi:nucleoside-diphosphate-sugar epimerase
VLGLARRLPDWSPGGTEWAAADVRDDDLVEHFRGADAVIHLAWIFQPTHDPSATWRNNVLGSLRVFDAVAKAGVPAFVHASSVGAYSPGPKDRLVDERWPTHGWPEAAYCREKAYLERALDTFEHDHPDIRVVRMRPGFLFKRQSAAEQRRLFAGPFLPNRLVTPGLTPMVPDIPGLRFQVLHTADAADAYVRAVLRPVRGPFNIAAPDIVDARLLADLMRARVVPLSSRPLRAAVATAWRLRLVPASPQLFDAVLRLPLMDTARAAAELGWTVEHSARETLREFLAGFREGAGMDTAPLAPRAHGGRLRELATGAGQRA